MISLGVIASGLVGGTPPVPGPPTGNLNMFGLFGSAGLVGAITEGDIPGAAPSLNVKTLACNAIYQRYRVATSGVDQDFLIAAIDGEFAISCSNTGGQYVVVTPFNKDAEVALDADWETSFTLETGVGVALIDSGANMVADEILLLEPGKFFIFSRYTVFSSTEDPTRTITLKIIAYTNPLIHSEIPILIDLDAVGVPSNFHFNLGNGVRGAAYNLVTRELTVTVSAIHFSSGYNAWVCVRVDIDTGDITHTELNVPESYVDGYLTALAGQSVITEDVFNITSFNDDASSAGNMAVRIPYPNMTRSLYVSRGVTANPVSVTNFVGETAPESIPISDTINEHLSNIGFTPTEAFDWFPAGFIPWVKQIQYDENSFNLAINNSSAYGGTAYGWNAAADSGLITSWSGPFTQGDLWQIFALDLGGTKQYVFTLMLDVEQDFLLKIESDVFGPDFIADNATFTNDGTYSKWVWVIDAIPTEYSSLDNDSIVLHLAV